jgi:hypothetical protein
MHEPRAHPEGRGIGSGRRSLDESQPGWHAHRGRRGFEASKERWLGRDGKRAQRGDRRTTGLRISQWAGAGIR